MTSSTERPPRVPFKPERMTLDTTTFDAKNWVINDIKIGNVSMISRWWHVRLWNRTIGRWWRRLTRRWRKPGEIRLI